MCVCVCVCVCAGGLSVMTKNPASDSERRESTRAALTFPTSIAGEKTVCVCDIQPKTSE